MAISVIEPIASAYHRTLWMLFKPFDIGKWFVLGFCAFLASLGERGGVGGNYSGWGGGHGDGLSGDDFRAFFNEATQWVQAHLALVIGLAVVAAALIIAVGVVFIWLNSRGKFMFLDGVVRNRGAVAEPWRRFKVLANSLVWFRLLLGLIALVLMASIVALGIGIAWPDIAGWRFGVRAFVALMIGGTLMFGFSLIFFLIGLVLVDFVVPAMYLRNLRTWPAWGVVWREVLATHPGEVILFYLMKLVLVIASGIFMVMFCCITCCIACCLAAIPYIGTVLLLPIPVFFRSYSLYFLEQFGDGWRIFPAAPPVVPPSSGDAVVAGAPAG